MHKGQYKKATYNDTDELFQLSVHEAIFGITALTKHF